jgi:hypothetical protein
MADAGIGWVRRACRGSSAQGGEHGRGFGCAAACSAVGIAVEAFQDKPKEDDRMALIDVVKWDAAGDELVWKFPNDALSTMTQLVVHESQWAMLYKDGQRLDTFACLTG